MREGRLTDEFRARAKKFAAFIIDFMYSRPKNAIKSKFVQGDRPAPAHLWRRTLGKPRGLVPMPRSSRNSVERSRKPDETQLWLELLREECGINCSLTTRIEQEADELIAIFTTIIRRTGAK